MSQFRTFAITVRPQNGFQAETEQAFIKWFQKQHHAFAVIEMDGVERHLHAQIFYESPKSKGDLNKQLERICSRTINDWSPAQERVLKRGTKVAYNDDWMDEYLAKEDNIIFNNPPDDTGPYYPSIDEQQRVLKAARAVDKRFHTWATDFTESEYYTQLIELDEVDEFKAPIIVAKFLAHQMFVAKKYPVVVEKRKRVEYAKCLWMYISEKAMVEEFLTVEDFEQYSIKLEEKYA